MNPSLVTKLCLTLCNPVDCNTPGFLVFTISQSLLKLCLVMLANQPCDVF